MQVTIDVGQAGKVIVVAIFAIVIFAIVAMLFKKVRGFFASRAFDVSDREAFRRRWQEVVRMLDRPDGMSHKLAVLEADKLLDHALKAMGMAGETMGERLKFAQYKYPQLREVWGAHKMRNQLAHEASFRLGASDARRAIRDFERALSRIGAI
jgi:hypothetical protein